jgi:SAM-dependent methyltransferase
MMLTGNIGVKMRNTDADWAAISSKDPYYAVLTSPAFLTENLNDAVIEEFFRTGRADVEEILRLIRTHINPSFSPKRALDFGSGVGRLVLAMADHAERVTGIDISPSMLAEAKFNAASRQPGKVIDFVDAIPDGPFDWISSVLVFQHIPPAVGMVRLRELLSRLASGGVASLNFTAFREPRHIGQAFDESRLVRFDGSRLEVVSEIAGPEVRMAMFDYDLTAVLAAYTHAGINRMWLEHIDFAGHHAFWVIGQKD